MMRLHLRMMASYAMTVPSASRLRQLFAARCPASYRMSGWKEALISCPSSPTTQSVTTSPRSCESPLESPIPLSRSLFYTRSLMILGCIRVVAIPREKQAVRDYLSFIEPRVDECDQGHFSKAVTLWTPVT